MKKNQLLLLIALLFFSNVIQSQNRYDINFPGNDRAQKCQRSSQTFRQMPREVKFAVKRDKTTTIYFEINNKNWFNRLFKNAGDGIAVDIVLKDRYDCANEQPEMSQIKGTLLRPIYAQQLKNGLKSYKQDLFRVRVGNIPAAYVDKEIEFNILFLTDKNLCQYYYIYDLASYKWDLLDMGLYLDSLTFKTRLNASLDKDSYTLKYKTLKFKIPFEKDKMVYSREDIKPMYDSLRLTDFTIKKINIRAYSSVEGSLKRNIELQEGRAQSIATALQEFQKPTIVTEVFSSENWVEFFNDISNSEYSNLKDLSKNQIKNKLVGAFSNEMEPYLMNHRKAVITLELEKKDKYKTMATDVLLDNFNNAIGDSKIEEAVDLQNSIFERLKGKVNSPALLDKMVIPPQKKYVLFLSKNAAFRYLLDEKNLVISYNKLKKLEKLAPKDGKVKYNIAALKFKIWKYNVEPVNEITFKKEIQNLKYVGISQNLIDRMLVNYHIIKSENYMRKREYGNKDQSVAYIYENYKKFPLTDYDYLSLAQFLSYYSNYEQAVELLRDKVKTIDVDEDLLFYYLNLTLIDKELTQSSDYRTMMLNAINMNKERFCKLFNPMGQGGVTFQLLDNFYLRKTYCENCIQSE